MCGIAGIFDYHGQAEIDRTLLRRMTDILSHRGPDGDGHHIAPGIGLGHRRLAIVDLATGDQPSFNEDGTICVVYNGEIYNFQPLMAELAALGHIFRTRCDTEVIVHAWEEWGAACLDRFNGMFAFALWDAAKEVLFLARDRLGEKPLYYSFLSSGQLLFASELKSLLLSPRVDREFDPRAIEEFFAFGYVPDLRSIYRGVRKLAPAHYLMVRRGEPPPEPRPYWDLRFLDGAPVRRDEVEEELIARLRESVRLRMIADVPLGAFLSGGALPSQLKLPGREGKYIFKTALEPHVRREISYLPKQGFAVPLAAWFRGPLHRRRLRETVGGPVLHDSGFFDIATVGMLLDQHQAGERDHSAALWWLSMIEAFLRQVHGGAIGEDIQAETIGDAV